MTGSSFAGDHVDNTSEVSLNETRKPIYPVTFRGLTVTESYAAVSPALRLPGDDGRPVLTLMIRAGDRATADGLVAFSGGVGDDFFAAELVDGGLLRVSADDGGGAASVVSTAAGFLADGRWHSVDIVAEHGQVRAGRRRPTRAAASPAALTVVVDDIYRDRLALAGGGNTVDLVGDLYVGGVPASAYRQLPPTVRSRRGFSGCLATFVANAKLYNLLNDARSVSDSVTAGCAGMSCLFCAFLLTRFCLNDVQPGKYLLHHQFRKVFLKRSGDEKLSRLNTCRVFSVFLAF